MNILKDSTTTNAWGNARDKGDNQKGIQQSNITTITLDWELKEEL